LYSRFNGKHLFIHIRQDWSDAVAVKPLQGHWLSISQKYTADMSNIIHFLQQCMYMSL